MSLARLMSLTIEMMRGTCGSTRFSWRCERTALTMSGTRHLPQNELGVTVRYDCDPIHD